MNETSRSSLISPLPGFSGLIIDIFDNESLSNSENTDFVVFIDVANIWGVDYDSSIDTSNKIRSSVGFGIDWFSILGPINFSLSQALSKNSTDKTETFRFNLGTTF